jgi:hypothetical protein
MKFPYARIRHSYMPVIPVTLVRGDRWIATEALADSGAASSIFDAQFADALGIGELAENGIEVVFEGVSGHTLIGYQHDVSLEVGGQRLPNVTIAFSRQMPDNAVNILGQQGFFELFPIKFTYRLKEIDLMTGSIEQQ